MADSVPGILIDNLRKTFQTHAGPVTALENITLSINQGEFFCIVGPSGCGKTTLLRILAGLEEATSGNVAAFTTNSNRPVNSMVFQEQSVFPWMTVLDNVGYGLRLRGVKKKERNQIAAHYIEMIGLTKFTCAYPSQLSGGMKQRAAIASSLINNPEILLMDEPFGALDALTREQMQGLIRKIWWNTGKTIFFITHDVDEALLLGTRILVMSKRPGRIIADFPAHFTKDFVEENSDDARYTETFHQKRKYILSLINEQ